MVKAKHLFWKDICMFVMHVCDACLKKYLHVYSEMLKLVEFQCWEQYVVLLYIQHANAFYVRIINGVSIHQ